MVDTIGCLSHIPLGYSTPQIQYMLRSLVDHYRARVPVAVFAPRWESHPNCDDQFGDFTIQHFWPREQHLRSLESLIGELIAFVKIKGFSRIGIYGAGLHSRALLELWKAHDGPTIVTLITSEVPVSAEVSGIPVVAVGEMDACNLEFVILSSGSFEAEMAANMRCQHPKIPFAALYDRHLSNLAPKEGWVEASARPSRTDELRTELASKWLESVRPELLVCTHHTYFESILKSEKLPRHLIYLAFEIPGGADGSPLEGRHWEEHRLLGSRLALVVYPEPNRRIYYQKLFQWEHVKAAVIYNASPKRKSAPLAPSQRNGKVLLQGSLLAQDNLVGYLPERTMSQPHIDVWGRLPEEDRACTILRDHARGSVHGYSYHGLLDNTSLGARRRHYAWTLVCWMPFGFDTLHACPNKFFEAIADGVPPIAGPHPQCRAIIEEHDCGILLRDWSFSAFEEGLREAAAVFGTERYGQLVKNCHRAHQGKLCWEHQFSKLKPLLPLVSR